MNTFAKRIVAYKFMLKNKFLFHSGNINKFSQVRYLHQISNLAVILKKVNNLELETIPVPNVKDNEVLVKMGYVQVGRADLHVSTLGKLRGVDLLSNLKESIVLGSLGTGIIEKIGPDVLGDLEVGDEVVLEPRIYCGNCMACLERNHQMCKNLLHAGIPPKDGMLQKYFTHPWHLCHKLPVEVSLISGSYSSTVAHCLQAYKLSHASKKSKVVVIGAGMAGSCIVKIFSSLGVTNLVVVDVFGNALKMMKKLGANYTVNTKVVFPPVSVIDEIVRHCHGGAKSDIVVDTVQTWASALIASELVRQEGTIVLFDYPSIPSQFNYIRYIDDLYKLINVIEVDNYGDEFKNAIHFLKTDQNLLDYIPPHIVPLDRGIDALSIARSKLSSKPCVIINCNPE